jgi:dATP pyrophosphohydrolase
MARAPFQVLAFPFMNDGKIIKYCIFKRGDDNNWQGIAGGGEGLETPEEAVLRESFEEANIRNGKLIKLQTIIYVPVYHFKDSVIWGENLYVIPEYSYGIDINTKDILISHEHTQYKWCSYQEAYELLRYDGNKTAIWELNQRIMHKGPRENEKT